MHEDFVSQEYEFEPNHVMFHKIAFEELALNRQSLVYNIEKDGSKYRLESGYEPVSFKNEDIAVYGAILQLTGKSRFILKTYLEIGSYLNFPMIKRNDVEVECRKASQSCRRLASAGYIALLPTTIANTIVPLVRCRKNAKGVFEEFDKKSGFENFVSEREQKTLFSRQEKVTKYFTKDIINLKR